MINHANFEANIVHGCNNRCASCNHLSPFAEMMAMDPATLARDLRWLKPILHVGFFCLQGGEPLLHPRILEFMDVAQASGIADRCGILSNGKLLPTMPDEFWQKCQRYNFELRCTVYPNLGEVSLETSKRKAAAFGVDFRPSGVTTTFLKMFGDYPNGETFIGCPWKECWTVHEGWFYMCPIAPFLADQILHLPMTTDGIEIHEGITEAEIMAYYQRTNPLKSCYKCAGTRGGGVAWHQPGNLDDWMKASTV